MFVTAHRAPGSRAGGPTRRHWPRLAATCVAAVLLTGRSVSAQPLGSLSSADLLSMDPAALAQRLHEYRPAAVSAEQRERILRSLPAHGEVHDVDASARRKLAALAPVLRRAQRESIYAIKVIDVPQATVAIYARMVLLIPRVTLSLLSAAELEALVAHEIGHEYVWAEHERAMASADDARLQELELICDIVAVATLRAMGRDPAVLISALDTLGRFNREHISVRNGHHYPSLARRRRVVRAAMQHAKTTTTPTSPRCTSDTEGDR
jgi:predicted Zn-dependent protease